MKAFWPVSLGGSTDFWPSNDHHFWPSSFSLVVVSICRFSTFSWISYDHFYFFKENCLCFSNLVNTFCFDLGSIHYFLLRNLHLNPNRNFFVVLAVPIISAVPVIWELNILMVGFMLWSWCLDLLTLCYYTVWGSSWCLVHNWSFNLISTVFPQE